MHLLALQDIVGYNLRELTALGLRHLGIAITWQVDQVPAVIYEEVVYELRLARCSRHLRKVFHAREHVYERRLAYIASADKGYILKVILGHLRNLLGATLELCFYGYCHNTFKFNFGKVTKKTEKMPIFVAVNNIKQ